MLFVTDDHRTVHMPKKTRQPEGVVPEVIDPVLLAAITQSPAQKNKTKPVVRKFKS